MSELVCKTLELLAETKGGFTSAVKNIFNTRTMATLKIGELSVGDWVRYDDRICQIAEIYHLTYTFECKEMTSVPSVTLYYEDDMPTFQESVPLKDIHPIPITAEILEKIGFESPSYYWSIYKDNGGYIEIWEDENRWYLSVNSVEYILCDLHWVHQIQHLMRVWGIDKEINL